MANFLIKLRDLALTLMVLMMLIGMGWAIGQVLTLILG